VLFYHPSHVICSNCPYALCCRLSRSPPAALEREKHKLKRLVQSPNSYFMDVKCAGCFQITTVFSHSQSVQLCSSCSTVLAAPTGGKCRLTEGASFR
jgi:small subunit ribosomal protein S27e